MIHRIRLMPEASKQVAGGRAKRHLPVMRWGVKAADIPAGAQDLMLRCRPVVSSRVLRNHPLLAAMPPESSRSKSVINGREEFTLRNKNGKAFFSFLSNATLNFPAQFVIIIKTSIFDQHSGT